MKKKKQSEIERTQLSEFGNRTQQKAELKNEKDLKDPLVHDDDGDIEAPPLKNCQKRSNDGPLAQPSLLHLGPRSL